MENVLPAAVGGRDLQPLRSVRSGTKSQGWAPSSSQGSPKKKRASLRKRSHVNSRAVEKVVQKDKRTRASFRSYKQRAREPVN